MILDWWLQTPLLYIYNIIYSILSILISIFRVDSGYLRNRP